MSDADIGTPAMARMNLREAADRTSRSITTLRRYIRSGKLRAEKKHGRYGPEYFVSTADLASAGLHPSPEPQSVAAGSASQEALVPRMAALPVTAPEQVPLELFRELQMKHEQLLVQYGMVRTAGLRTLELRAELEAARREGERALAELRELRGRRGTEATRLARKLREAELELEGRRLEIAALREKVRALEMMTRNSVTSESIERQFSRLLTQADRVRRMTGESKPPSGEPRSDAPRRRRDDTDH